MAGYALGAARGLNAVSPACYWAETD